MCLDNLSCLFVCSRLSIARPRSNQGTPIGSCDHALRPVIASVALTSKPSPILHEGQPTIYLSDSFVRHIDKRKHPFPRPRKCRSQHYPRYICALILFRLHPMRRLPLCNLNRGIRPSTQTATASSPPSMPHFQFAEGCTPTSPSAISSPLSSTKTQPQDPRRRATTYLCK
ncbi:hypothetical protein K458DRAFT_82783 [Lentithecium fluviatile CBS 122367]|uniref:Uncharacterized protein n=1 Tax=Lentithecium fluviatile CBS 122367 TaxID=1168545 RepID=A0A6G1ISM6_9PLEO|nr:hypothetical protein K458DRAFT_82783 [Lentithecium fluviatile CBS 122367]